jgi:class 3 adenylate cyclase/tetratricopeptide (TPR) repeat protein
MRADRFLATILFTDIVSSTERAAELGDRRWRQLLQRHHAIVRREITRFGGRELNMTGDGFLATFDVPERALRCACSIRAALRALELEIRSGLHTGEVEVMDKTVGGLGVHIGARVGAKAAAGEILVSSTVRDMVTGSGFEFEDRGRQVLKGIPGEWQLYAVAGEPLRLPVASLWMRARVARLPRVLLLYVIACAGVLSLTTFLRDQFQLPAWVFPLAMVLLLIGLVILSATAWVQSRPLTALRAEREEVPGSWEIDLGDVGKSVVRGRVPHLTWGRSLLGGVVAFSLLFGLAGLYVLVKDRGRSFSPTELRAAPGPALAVLPFRVVGANLELWREGMVDLLSTNLDAAGGIRSIAPRTVLSKWRSVFGEAVEPSDPQALQVARELGAKYALIGSMVALGGEVRLTAQIYDLKKGEQHGETQVRGLPDSIPALVDRLSLEILRTALARELDALPEVDLRGVTTSSLPALKAYLAGEQSYRRSRWQEAITHFTRAVEADSTFALALHRLSLAHGWVQGFSAQSVAYSERAARFIDRLPEREALLVRANAEMEQGKVTSIETLERLTTLHPDDAEGWAGLGEAYYHIGLQALHPREKSLGAFRRAIEIDPSFSPAYVHLLWEMFALNDSLVATELYDRYREIDSTSVDAKGFEIMYALQWGDDATKSAARTELETLSTDVLGSTLVAPASGELWQARLHVNRARLAARHPLEERKNGQLQIALTHLLRGRIREARQALLTVSGEDPYGLHNSRHLLYWHVATFPDSSTAARVAEVVAASPFPEDRLMIGMFKASEGRWQEAEEQIRALESSGPGTTSEQTLGVGTRTTSAVVDGAALAQALRGYVAARQGDTRTAIHELEQALPKIPGHCPSVLCPYHALLRYETGRLQLAANNPRAAVQYLESVQFRPHLTAAELYMGRAHEALGNMEKAKLNYGRVVRWWEDCDPELRPMWEEARQALNRLQGVRKL